MAGTDAHDVNILFNFGCMSKCCGKDINNDERWELAQSIPRRT